MIAREDKAYGRQLTYNVVAFTRLLRRAGLPVGPSKSVLAVDALDAVDIRNRKEFYWALHSVLVNKRDHHTLFDEAFKVFWRTPNEPNELQDLLNDAQQITPEKPNAASRRLAEAVMAPQPTQTPTDFLEIDAEATYSADEVLRSKDFEQMSVSEVLEARKALSQMKFIVAPRRQRRFRPGSQANHFDLRRTMRASLRGGGDVIPIQYRKRIEKRPPLVVLCDISGSMASYTRMFLHFLHTLTHDGDRVHSFVFGTRLNNISRQLKSRDVDDALEHVARAVEDWGGGTRIGDTIKQFNKLWSRRVLGQGAVVILITDGLDRDAGEGLAPEMERLHRSCTNLIWLNPLLRYDQFEPKSLGIKAMLPHVDAFLPVHNLNSLSDLANALSKSEFSRHNDEWTLPRTRAS